MFLAALGGLADNLQFFLLGTPEKRLLFAGQAGAKIDQALHVDFAHARLQGQVHQARQFVHILAHGGKPEREARALCP